MGEQPGGLPTFGTGTVAGGGGVLRRLGNGARELLVVHDPVGWARFREILATDTRACGDRAPDAWIAALVLEGGAVLAAHDRGLARFEGLELVDHAG